MKLSTKGRYGLRAIIDLAANSETEAVSISSIAARQSLSEGYLEQLMAKLKKSGLIKSIRGAQGGYMLAMPAQDISVGDILRSLEGELSPVQCPALEAENACSEADCCVTKYVWRRIRDSINDAVDEIKLSDLVSEGKTMKNNSQNTVCGV